MKFASKTLLFALYIHATHDYASIGVWNSQILLFGCWLFHVWHETDFWHASMKAFLCLSDLQYNVCMYHQPHSIPQPQSIFLQVLFLCKSSNQSSHHMEKDRSPKQCDLNILPLQFHTVTPHLWTYVSTTFCRPLSFHLLSSALVLENPYHPQSPYIFLLFDIEANDLTILSWYWKK